MLKGIKIRLYLNDEQQSVINRLLGSYRFVYNSCLSHKIDAYKNKQKTASLSDLGHYFHQGLRNEFEWLQEHNTKVLKQSIINLEQAYKNFFKLHNGFPKFKSKNDVQKCRFPVDAISKNAFDEETSRLNLTMAIKELKFECSVRDKQYLYKNKSGIKSITIIKNKCDQYYASVLIDGDLLRAVNEPIRDVIGVDLGIKTLITFSNGETVANPKWTRTNEKQLKKLQKQLSKKQKGSNNRCKAKLRLAKKHERIHNQKIDFLHNITTKIVSENQTIILEDLNVSGMMKNRKLAKAIQELGLFEMRRQIEYKSKWYGRNVVFVSRWFASSKTCSCCGWVKHDLKLSDREFVCEKCNFVIDRDENAAINIEKEGIRIYNEQIGQRLPEFTLADYPTMDDPSSNAVLKSSGRLKQENNVYIISCKSC